MSESSKCQRCSATLTGQTVGKLCAKCLLNLALEPALGDISPPSLSPGDPVFPAPFGAAPEQIKVHYFGDYELLEEIARGGMGVVYKARQVSLNRIVALKMILGGDFSSPEMMARFQVEAEAAARLEHPNIVPIYEIGTHQGQRYFSMRFVEGGTLTQALARARFNFAASARLMIAVARAVHYAHQHSIIHRDLKPGNILLDASGEPHVADFGLAKILEQDSALTLSAVVMGTPSYMAPEQAAGETRQISTASDIYSLGAIFYHVLTGKPPFRGATPAETMRQVIDAPPERPSALNRDLDRDLETICLKCLEKEPSRRYGSAAAFGDDLERWSAGEPIYARRVQVVERTLKWARRKPVVAGLVAALHLVALTGLAGVLWQNTRVKEEAGRATLEAKRATAEAGNARREWSRAEGELWNARLNEARAVRIAGGSGARLKSSALVQKLIQRPGLMEPQLLRLREEAIAQMALMDIAMPTNWIPKPSWVPLAWNATLDQYVRDTGSNRVEWCEFPSERVLASFSGPAKATFHGAVFSADNQFLAVRFSNAKGEVRVWKLDTHEQVLRTLGTENLGYESESVRISPDSRTLLTLTAQGVVLQPIATNGQARSLQPVRHVRRAEFSPDSRKIAVLPDTRDTVEIWDADSGEIRCSFNMSFNPHKVAWHPAGSHLLLGGSRGQVEMRTLTAGDGAGGVSAPLALGGHVGSIQHIMFTPDGATAITYAWDYSSLVRDFVSGRPLLREHRIVLQGVNATGDRLLVRRENPIEESVATLLPRVGYRTAAWAGEPRSARGVWVSPDGRLGVVAYEHTDSKFEADCILWDSARGVEIARLKGVWAQFSADSRTLFTFERPENRVRRYDVSQETLANRPALWSEGKVVYRGGRGERINTGRLAPDGRTLVIAATDAVIFLDTLDQQFTRIWKEPAHGVVLSNDGKWVATTKHNELSVLRSAHTGEAKVRLPQNSRVGFSSDSRWMAVATQSEVTVYELESLHPESPHPAYPPIVLEVGSGVGPPVEFSPDSRMFAVPYNRTHVRLYETATGRELATLSPPHLGQIIDGKALEFSPDGQWVVAAKDDGETVAWNLPTIRRELAKLGLDWKDAPP